jgi:PAS domain S-box-containing protein
MDRRLHDMRNDLAVAIGTLHAFIDGRLAPDAERLGTMLRALESLDTALPAVLDAATSAPVTAKEHLLNAVIEGSPYAKVLVDVRGAIVLVNAQTEALFGYTRDELLGRPIEMLVPERFRRGHPVLRTHFSEAPVARPMGAGRDLYGLRKDGSEMPIEIGLNPIVAGPDTFTLAAITDITERRRAEELRLENAGMQLHAAELEELNRELESASRFKTEFVATMSHELRTPLGAIIGAAELLAKTPLATNERAVMQTISDASEALLALINSVLDFSKIEAGKLELFPETFDLGAVVKAAADVAGQLARDKPVSIQAYVDPNITDVTGDVNRLRQVLLNLVGNAVKFTDRGSVVVRATVRRDAPGIRFEIEDTGIGIEERVLPQLFEPFAQADRSASRRFAGTGLGLSIARSLVELMGGEIGVRSVAGTGSCFWFTVPFALVQRAAAVRALPAGPLHHPAPVPNGAGPPAPARILVAEDNEQLQRLLALQFAELGADVTFVADGKAAVEALRAEPFALVFMDCQMPNLDGFDATKLIRHDEATTGRHVPIAAMTANAFADDRDACLRAGMDDYLAKPVKLADLQRMIERWSL